MAVDADYFFYYGMLDEREEIEADLRIGVMQSKRSMFYYRSFGAGISDYENESPGLSVEVSLKYDIALWVARRNQEVTGGVDGFRDRRALTSQNAISVTRDEEGFLVNMLYIPYFDYEKPARISVPIGG